MTYRAKLADRIESTEKGFTVKVGPTYTVTLEPEDFYEILDALRGKPAEYEGGLAKSKKVHHK